jgi:hypothetical protein
MKDLMFINITSFSSLIRELICGKQLMDNMHNYFLQNITRRPTLGLTQWVPGALSLGVKRSGREADRSSPYSAEVKE